MKYRALLGLLLFLLVTAASSPAESFKVFSSSEANFVAPDGRYLMRSVNHNAASSNLPGSFHTLELQNLQTGNSQPLFDYHGILAAAWTKNDLIIVTEYINRSISRTLVFAPDGKQNPVVISPRMLARLVPSDIGAHLTSNNHVYVEAATVDDGLLKLRVWGYGARDEKGFSFRCQYDLQAGTASCRDTVTATASFF